MKDIAGINSISFVCPYYGFPVFRFPLGKVLLNGWKTLVHMNAGTAQSPYLGYGGAQEPVQ